MRVFGVKIAAGLGVAGLAATITASGMGGPPTLAAAAGPASRAARITAGVNDEVLAGVGQPDGYHLFVARSADRWSWEPLVVLDPGGASDQGWIGNTCVTGDGQTGVAVVAPWSASNSTRGIESGGVAYAVNLSTGQARVLATGVSMAYFNPGCGAGHEVALTSYLGDAEQSTRVRSVNALTGAVTAAATLPGEFTSAVPVSGSILAAHGDKLVRLTGTHAIRIATLPGEAFQLRPNEVGGVDLLAANSGSSGSAWRYHAGSLLRLGAGPLSGLSLLAEHSGATFLTGTRATVRASGLSSSRADGSRILASSQLGTAMLVAPAKAVTDAAILLPQILSASDAVLRNAAVMPDAVAPRITGTTIGPVSTSASRAARRASATAAQTPVCAVERDDPAIQVPQPSNEQIDWAIQHAVANSLPSRPSGFDNLPGGAYSPEADFPQPALTGAGHGGHVPALLVAGILAQESNFNQASWHAPAGTAGDPLIADYYGDSGSSDSIDYSAADCGYGLGQITDIMNAGNSIGLTIQRRVAVDYTENIAAVVRHLADTWNQLAAYSPSITVNSNNPTWLENWYDTIWAYNSGVEPRSSAYGLPAGCTAPGPSCTDSAGNWGLGWANNPINPVFKPGRPVFLSDSYADAATPSEWPYQERVFGWMATPLLRYDVTDGGTEAAYPTASQYLLQPSVTAFCSSTVDNCNPNDPSDLYCNYQANNSLQYHCWWHGPVTFAGQCASAAPGQTCTNDRPLSSATGEPSAPDPDPPVCNLDTSQVPVSTSAGSTIVVTEESGSADPGGHDINVVGCTGSRNWTAAGSFSVAYATDSQGDPLGQVDFHQLGGGFGGHLYFTHLVPPSGADTNKVTGTWAPGISGTGNYQIKVFVPGLGAVADPAVYTVTTSNGQTAEVTINQNDYGNQWTSLGDFSLSSNAAVSLTNVTPSGDYASDLAFGAVAFIPEPGRLVQHTLDGFSNFSNTQSLNGNNPSTITGDFTSDSSLIQMADTLTSGLLNYQPCASSTTSSCVPQSVLTAMNDWQTAVAASNGHPVQWLGFSRPTPPSPLTSAYLDDGTHYKVRASTTVSFLVGSNGQIVPGSYAVTATDATGITELPAFITEMFQSIDDGYQIAQPDLTYSAANLEYFNGASIAVDPLGTGLAPGREYMPDLSVQLTNNNTCLQVEDLAGGSIGWKTLLTDDNVVSNASAWRSSVDNLVQDGLAPQALANLADTVIKDFFTRPLQWGVVPWPGDGSIFYYAPPIWVETHFQDCVSGSTDTLSPAGSVDPATGKAQLIDSSYMPDLYLAIDGTYVDKYGNPNNGNPVQAGDWPDFAASPLSVSPFPSPWNPCYIGPTEVVGSATIYFISRRDGNPWNLPMLSPGDLSSSVGFC